MSYSFDKIGIGDKSKSLNTSSTDCSICFEVLKIDEKIYFYLYYAVYLKQYIMWIIIYKCG